MIRLITLDYIATEFTNSIGVYCIRWGNGTVGTLIAGSLFDNANGNASGFGVGGQFAHLLNCPALNSSFFLVQP